MYGTNVLSGNKIIIVVDKKYFVWVVHYCKNFKTGGKPESIGDYKVKGSIIKCNDFSVSCHYLKETKVLSFKGIMNNTEMQSFDVNEPIQRNPTKTDFIPKLNSKCILFILLFIGLTNCLYLFMDKIKNSHFDVLVSKLLTKFVSKNITDEE